MSISTKPTWRVSTSTVVAIMPRAEKPTMGSTRISNSGISRCGACHSHSGVNPTRGHQRKRVSTTAMKIPGTRTSAKRHQVLPPTRAAGGDDPADRDQRPGLDGEDADREAPAVATPRPDEEDARRRHDQADADLDQPVKAGEEMGRGRHRIV